MPILYNTEEYLLIWNRRFNPVTFTENGTWEVPKWCHKIRVDCVAAKGGASGGLGGRVQCVLSVNGGETLNIIVGKIPATGYIAEYNASDIRTTPDDLYSRLVVAGGGGSGSSHRVGGAGGGLIGAQGGTFHGSLTTGGGGGTQTAGGAAGIGVQAQTHGHHHPGEAGTFGMGANGGTCGYDGNRGAGGAGWYGGGSGGGSWCDSSKGTAAGGGGSSYTDPDLCSEVVHTQGYQNGSGYITISMV